jgi:hypothetical protein
VEYACALLACPARLLSISQSRFVEENGYIRCIPLLGHPSRGTNKRAVSYDTRSFIPGNDGTITIDIPHKND